MVEEPLQLAQMRALSPESWKMSQKVRLGVVKPSTGTAGGHQGQNIYGPWIDS